MSILATQRGVASKPGQTGQVPVRGVPEKPRLLFVSHTAEIGGPTHSLVFLARYLRQAYEVAVLTPESGPLEELLQRDQVPVFVIPGLRFTAIPKIAKLIRGGRFDLVYGNNPSSCARNALVASKLSGRPFIWHFRAMKQHWSWKKGAFIPWADRIIAVSHACARSLERFRPVDQINVVHNGVEATAFDGDYAAARVAVNEELGLPSRSRYLISVSHVLARKRVDYAVEIMANLLKRWPTAHLLVVGRTEREPEYTARIRNLVRERGLSGHVHLLGLRRDVPQLLKAADVFLHTAERDPHPRAVLEAMAAELAVVAFSVDGVAETVVDGVSGNLVPFGEVSRAADAIDSLLQDTERRLRLGRNGRRRIEESFTAEQTASGVAAVIAELLSGSGRHARHTPANAAF